MVIILFWNLVTPQPKVKIAGGRTRNFYQSGIQRKSQRAHKISPESVKQQKGHLAEGTVSLVLCIL